jgi:hypothetical protein
MDLYCTRCGEPYDMDEVWHNFTPEEKGRWDREKGCPSCYGKEVGKKPFRAELASTLGDLMGDDVDGLAAEMEDAEALFGEKFWE